MISPEDDLRKVVNRHGFGFQYAVLRKAEQLHEQGLSPWVFDASEVPVEVRGSPTRIDFVLRQRSGVGGIPSRYLVGECKRANPALSNWCFTKSRFIRRNLIKSAVIVDQVTSFGNGITHSRESLGRPSNVFSLGFEVRADEKGEGSPDKNAIESACGQVLKGVNGLVDLFRSKTQILLVNQPTPLIPVVFTTAKLWTSEADVADADILSGEVAPGVLSLVPAPWLWYRYHATPGITDSEQKFSDAAEIGKLVEDWYARTIAIVSAAGVEDFLCGDFEL